MKKTIGKIGLVAFFLAYAVLFLQNSKAVLGIGWAGGKDSAVFYYIGRTITKGLVPYRDVFDHKGPLLYLIDALGDTIHSGYGLWFVQLVFMTALLAVLYKTCRLFEVNRSGCIAVLILLWSVFTTFYDGGNLTEEYAMVFMAIAQYFFIEYLIKRKTSWLRVALIGLCLACICMLRPNMIGIWAGYILIILILLLKNKEYLAIGKYALWMLGGLVIGVLPILIWFLATGSMGDFVDCLWRFNFTYAGRNTFTDIIDSFRFFFLDTRKYFLIVEGGMALVTVYLIIKKDKYAWACGGILCAFMITAYLICSPGNAYRHYGMAIIPVFAAMACIDMEIFSRFFGKKKTAAGILCCIAAFWLGYPHILHDMRTFKGYLENDFQGLEIQDSDIIEVIKANSDRKDKIQVLGNRCDIYLNSDRMAASRYIYQEAIAMLRPGSMDELAQDISCNKPKLIVEYCPHTEKVRDVDGDVRGVIEDAYHIIYEDDRFKIYEVG